MGIAFEDLPVLYPREPIPTDVIPYSPTAEYRLGQRLGEGASGCVYAATRTSHPAAELEHVAIKIFLPLQRIAGTVQGLRQAASRFSSEAHRAQHLAHPHLVPILDFGELRGTSSSATKWSGLPFYVMPLVRGMSLAELIPSEADMITRLGWLSQLSDAVSYLHRNGIQHRDIKPENVIVGPANKEVYLVDFGVAKWNDWHPELTDGFMTATGANLTTWEYTPRETEAIGRFDDHSDVWSFSKVAVELVCGRRVPRVDILTGMGVYASMLDGPLAGHRFLRHHLSHGLRHDPETRPGIDLLDHAIRDYKQFLGDVQALNADDYRAIAAVLEGEHRMWRREEWRDILTRIGRGGPLAVEDFPAFNWPEYLDAYPSNGCPQCGGRLWTIPCFQWPRDLDGWDVRVCFGTPGATCGQIWSETISADEHGSP